MSSSEKYLFRSSVHFLSWFIRVLYIFRVFTLTVLVTQSCLSLCDPVECSPPGSSVHGILQARILEWVAIPFSRGSAQPRDQIWVSCTAVRFFTVELPVSSHLVVALLFCWWFPLLHESFSVWYSPICLFLLWFPSPEETDLKKNIATTNVNVFFLGVLCFQILQVGLQTILSLFLYVVLGSVLISFFYK